MTACVFLGPSLPAADARALYPQCRFLPPVQHGSVYEAMQKWPLSAIGIIDGYFQHRPSVWHKEILWAIDQGVYVVGAASMGALRAAELAPFGMVGIGKVFKAFEQGAMPPFIGLNDDDEVAIVHGPAESGFIGVSEAMVNVRHTLDAACLAEVIDLATADILTKVAKSLHFSDRKYAAILDQARNQGVSDDKLQHFAKWLPAGKIDQKREDAIELIKHMASIDHVGLPANNKCFYFEKTEIFHDALQSQPYASHSESILIEQDSDVLDELRLNQEAYLSAKHMALVKSVLARHHSPLSPVSQWSKESHSDQQMQRSINNFRQANRLFDRANIDQWLAENDLELTELEDLMLGEAQFDVKMSMPDLPPMSTELINQLKLRGDYRQFASRARQKRDVLASKQQPMQQQQLHLLDWYFEKQCSQPVPADMDEYAQRLGLPGKDDLIRLIECEYYFVTHM